MLSKCPNLIEYPIPFYITNDDVDILSYSYKRTKQLVIEKPSDILVDNDKYYCDYLITPVNNEAYKRNQEKPDYTYPYLLKFDDGVRTDLDSQVATSFTNLSKLSGNFLL